jgi:hypothetical protein
VTFQYDGQWFYFFLYMNMSFTILWCFVLFLLPMWIIIIELGYWDIFLIKAMWYQWKINKLDSLFLLIFVICLLFGSKRPDCPFQLSNCLCFSFIWCYFDFIWNYRYREMLIPWRILCRYMKNSKYSSWRTHILWKFLKNLKS